MRALKFLLLSVALLLPREGSATSACERSAAALAVPPLSSVDLRRRCANAGADCERLYLRLQGILFTYRNQNSCARIQTALERGMSGGINQVDGSNARPVAREADSEFNNLLETMEDNLRGLTDMRRKLIGRTNLENNSFKRQIEAVAQAAPENEDYATELEELHGISKERLREALENDREPSIAADSLIQKALEAQNWPARDAPPAGGAAPDITHLKKAGEYLALYYEVLAFRNHFYAHYTDVHGRYRAARRELVQRLALGGDPRAMANRDGVVANATTVGSGQEDAPDSTGIATERSGFDNFVMLSPALATVGSALISRSGRSGSVSNSVQQHETKVPQAPPATASLRAGSATPKETQSASDSGLKGSEIEEARREFGFERLVTSRSEGGRSGTGPDPFSGALGMNPIFTSPSQAEEEGSRSPGSLDDLFEASEKEVAATEQLYDLGRSRPGFAGSSSSEPSLGDLFKRPEAQSPAPPRNAHGDLLTPHGSRTTAISFQPGSQGEKENSVESRSLFARVKEFHLRCLKRGCVTTEEGGRL
jgi:hypothetical protein